MHNTFRSTSQFTLTDSLPNPAFKDISKDATYTVHVKAPKLKKFAINCTFITSLDVH